MSIVIALWLLAAPAGADDPPALRKGPWLMDVRPDSIAVLAELEERGALIVEAVPAAGGPALRVESGGRTLHEVVLRGLSAGTEYRYSLSSGPRRLARGRFTTAPPPGQGPVRFVVYGDSRDDAASHLGVVRAVREVAPDFVVSTGDVVGRGDEPGDWQEFFDTTGALFREVPFFPLLGNHELVPPENEGLPHYRRWLRAPDADGPTAEADYAFQYGPVRFVVINDRQDFRAGTAARAWLEATLAGAAADPTAPHLFVAMHHGPFSSGRHGENRRAHEAGLPALFREHGVDLIFSGHDHLYERGEARGLKYVVSGGGGAVLYPFNDRRPYQLAFDPVFHFVRVDVDGDRVEVSAVQPNGRVIDRCGFERGGTWHCPGQATAPGAPPGAGRIVGTSEGLARVWIRTGWWILALAVAFLALGWWGLSRLRRARRMRMERMSRASRTSVPST